MVNDIDIVSLDEAKDFLRIDSDAYDDKLGGFITAASQMWNARVGQVAGSPTFDEWYDGGGSTIVLRHTPVQSITSITESYVSSLAYTLTQQPLDGTGVSGFYGYTFDAESGVIVRRANGMATAFAAGARNVHIVYVAGYATVPEDVKQAVKLLIQHLWETQRGAGGRPGSAAEPTSTFTWPRRVLEIADSYIVPGIA